MAFAVDADRATTNVDATTNSPAFNLPQGSPSGLSNHVGKLLVMAWRSGGSTTVTGTGGFTVLASVDPDASDDRMWIGYKVVDGTEGATVGFTMTGTARKYAAICWLIEDGGTPTVTTTSGSGTTPNPPSNNPAGGAADFLWLAFGCNEDTRTVSGYPTNYATGQVSVASTSGSGAARCTSYGASRQLNADSEDPGNFTVTVTTQWMAATIAIPFEEDPVTDTFVPTAVCY